MRTSLASSPFPSRRGVRLVALALVAAALTAAPAAAASNVEFRNSDVGPFSETDVACSGELVDISGTLHHRVVIVVDERGGVHTTAITRGIGTGVADSGTRYVGVFVDTSAQYFGPGDVPATGTFPFFFRLISNDGSPDLMVRQQFHITVNANGEITSFTSDTTVSC